MNRIVVLAVMTLCAASALGGECANCRMPFSGSVLNCWACGTHLPGAVMPSDVVKLDLAPILIRMDGVATKNAASMLSPEVAYAEVDRWISENPKKHAEALARLQTLLTSIEGTGFETTVMKRMNAVRAAKSEAEKPRSPQERLKEAAREYTVVMGQVGKEPDRIINNIKMLEGLMDVCAGTPYEALVKKQLEIQRAKASMR